MELAKSSKKFYFIDKNSRQTLATLTEAVGRWLADRTRPDPEGYIPCADLWEAWQQDEESHPAPWWRYEARVWFDRALTALGYQRYVVRRRRVIVGIVWQEGSIHSLSTGEERDSKNVEESTG